MSDRSPLTPPWVVHAEDVSEVEGHYPAPFDAERLSFGRDLRRAQGSVKLGLWRSAFPPGAGPASRTPISPGRSSCTYFRASAPGEAAREIPLRAGHAVALVAGTELAHCVVNRGDRDCLLLVVGERREEDRVLYPEDPGFDAHVAERRPERWWRR